MGAVTLIACAAARQTTFAQVRGPVMTLGDDACESFHMAAGREVGASDCVPAWPSTLAASCGGPSIGLPS